MNHLGMPSDKVPAWLESEQQQIAALLQEEGRALAISLPEEALAETLAFQNVLHGQLPSGRIFIAHKATDRTHVIRQLVEKTGIGVDVASIGELEACLRQGIAPEDLIVTGPKATALLSRAIDAGVKAIVLDGLGELQRLIELQASDYPDVLLRLSRSMINGPGVTRLSRFGFDKASYEVALSLLRETPNLRLRGLAFHLDTKSIDEKNYAAHAALDLLAQLPDRGFPDASVLDIGGGFGHAYGLTPSQLHMFDMKFREAVRSGTLDTYQAMSYGLKRLSDGQITGDYMPMDMPAFPVAAERLQTLLLANKFASKAEELLIDIWCEPGSALLTNAGVVASEIIDVTPRDGRLDVTLNIHHGQVLFDRNEVLTDPIHVPLNPANTAACNGYLLGVLCMESDLLSHRPMHFKQTPRSGDILVWPRTGAYRMHMSQTNAIMHPDMARYRYENKQFIKDEQ